MGRATKDTDTAFCQGWMDGVLLGERTARQAETDYPEYTVQAVDAYCQGSIDGRLNDAWRLNRLVTA